MQTASSAPLSLSPSVRSASGRLVHELSDGWQMCLGTSAWTPAQADAQGVWLSTRVPTTAAATLVAHGRWRWGDHTDFDAHEIWFRRELPACEAAHTALVLEGIATSAEVFLGGEALFQSDSMFVSHARQVTSALREPTTLHVRCAPLASVLKQRRPRPRWPSRLVNQRNLRFVRTTMLGRMPGFLPSPAPVGPFRPIWLIEDEKVVVEHLRLRSVPTDAGGRVQVEARVRCLGDGTLRAGQLRVGDVEGPIHVTAVGEHRFALEGNLELRNVERWWPHTHGEPRRYDASIRLETGSAPVLIECEPVAFRELSVDAGPPQFAFAVNGEPLFARGACWMPTDAVRLSASETELRKALSLVREAGMNMLRLPGFSVYESPVFHSLCDELGILVWQDLMFANLDYPADDPTFAASTELELEQLLVRIADRPSTALICGNSEAEQQAAMMGLAPVDREQPFFEETLRAAVQTHGGVAYWPSTPHGGALPFRTSTGTTHYYGVGAYERSFADLRAAQVRFTPECLAFAQLPEDDAALSPSGELFHSPGFRAGVPRDPGASWDFSDTTEHYVERLYEVDAHRLRRSDPERHLELWRRAPAVAMTAAQGVWRRGTDPCAGALIFTLRDVRPGAGWGLIANDGAPKAAYWALRRVWAARALWWVDDGLDGMHIWLANDASEPWCAPLTLRTMRADGHTLLEHTSNVEVPPRATQSFDAESLLGHFADLSRAYRFGAREHDVLWAAIHDGEQRQQAVWIAGRHALETQADLGLAAHASRVDSEHYRVHVTSQLVAQSVRVVAPDVVPSDNYFDVVPGEPYSLLLRLCSASERAPRARLWPLNAHAPTPVVIE